MKSKNTIEPTGQHSAIAAAATMSAKVRPAPTIDGFFKAANHAVTTGSPVVAQKISVLAPAAAPAPRRTPKQRPQASHAKAHQPQSATTLMRSAVRRPAPSLKQQASVNGSLQHKVPSLIAPKQSVYQIDPSRLSRAQQSSRSPQISRHSSSTTTIPVTVAPLAVQPVPVKPEAKEAVAAPEPHAKPLDMFEHAIANASHYVDVKTHHAQFKKHRRNHALSLAGSGLAVLVIAGFVAYHNSAALQLKIASIKSGVASSMPNFKAAGFAYTGAKAADGKLTVAFHNSDGQYKLVQQTTNLSSDDVINNIGSVDASGYPIYSTVKAGDTTVYRFSNNDATWVSSGKWYTVSGNQALTDSQVTSLVNNL